MTIDHLKTPAVALGTWAWGDSGETGNGYFGSHLTQASLEEPLTAHAIAECLAGIHQVQGSL